MASWLTHLRVAAKIKEKIKAIDLGYLMLGSVTPDLVEKGEHTKVYEPSKELVFSVCSDESSVDIPENFYSEHMLPEKLITRSDKTRSFLWGYYFHLVVDRAWREEVIKPVLRRQEQTEKQDSPSFQEQLRDEIDLLDFEYLKNNGLEIIEELMNVEVNISFFGDFDTSYIYDCKNKIVEYYNKQSAPQKDSHNFINEASVEDFINRTSDKCIRALL